jgi:hypothetical protein
MLALRGNRPLELHSLTKVKLEGVALRFTEDSMRSQVLTEISKRLLRTVLTNHHLEHMCCILHHHSPGHVKIAMTKEIVGGTSVYQEKTHHHSDTTRSTKHLSRRVS